MSYQIKPQKISQSKRAKINEYILSAIDENRDNFSKEEIYNTYTGLGGLHGLNQKDFDNYNQYAKAKQKIEKGQFFTPHQICQNITTLAAIGPTETVLDMGCGMGNFFNFLPNIQNAHGFDIDPVAVKVARHLYPEANIKVGDITQYQPKERFDVLLGNPPYNMQFNNELSQFYYCKKAYDVLNPAALMFLVVPVTFMQSEFWDKSQVRVMDNKFSFIGQTRFPNDAFTDSGVEEFATKLMVFSRASIHVSSCSYCEDEFVSMETLTALVEEFRTLKRSLKLQLRKETNHLIEAEERDFNFKIGKYLFELKTHPHLQAKYEQAVALVSKFRDQKPPENASPAQFQQYEQGKLTYAKVLAVIRRYIRQQNYVPREEVALVKTSYSFKLKAYAPHLLDDIAHREEKLYNLIIHGGGLPDAGKWMTPKVRGQYTQAMKFIERKRREYLRQSAPYKEMKQDEALTKYIDKLRFINPKMNSCEFIPLQKHDMNLIFQKRYNLLNWQQGSGKTAVAYHYAKYIRAQGLIHNTVVVAPALAIELTWEPFLKRQKKKYVRVTKPSDLDNIRQGVFAIVSISMLGKLEKTFKKFTRLHSNNLCLIFDESDEITNDISLRTKRALNLFRRLKYKILTTGTTTRNNVAELYGQIALLYNNSVNMMCRCPMVYHEDKQSHIITSQPNDDYGRPFPARGGAALFKACFCPSKASVFGIEKHSQDIYNKNHLLDLIGKTVLTRKFKEFAGDKYVIRSHNVEPGEGEKAVYEKILKDFLNVCKIYFKSTGNSRKNAAMKMIRQIQLMIKACSIANMMPCYRGEPFPRKTRFIADMVRDMPGKVCIGCTTIDAMEMYVDYMSMAFPDRPLFVIHGEISFNRRKTIIEKFEETENGILVCTQQSLKSSVNIPSCNDVILESLLWNIPRMEQFYFRFIRLDSEEITRVHFVLYNDSIEQNLMALVTTKERLNEFIKSGEIKQQSEIFEEFDISESLIENMLRRERDKNGKLYLTWGRQKLVA